MALCALVTGAPVHAHQLRLAKLSVEVLDARTVLIGWRSSDGEAAPTISLGGVCREIAAGDTANGKGGEQAGLVRRFECPEVSTAGSMTISGTSAETPIVMSVIDVDGKARSTFLPSASRHEVPWSSGARQSSSLAAYFFAGARHVLAGADHLLFLLALVFSVTTLPLLVKLISLFTLGHATTLVLVSLGIVGVDPRLAEVAIALTLVVTAREVYRVRVQRHPGATHFAWTATIFGLVHGLGFAGALEEIGVQSSGSLIALASFNSGVEAGQLAAIALAWFPIKLVARRDDLAGLAVPRLASLLIGSCGVFWCLERL